MFGVRYFDVIVDAVELEGETLIQRLVGGAVDNSVEAVRTGVADHRAGAFIKGIVCDETLLCRKDNTGEASGEQDDRGQASPPATVMAGWCICA